LTPGRVAPVEGTAIARVEVYGYELTYVGEEYVMSGGRTIASLASTVVRVVTEDGVEGFGETCPLGSTYLAAHAEGARAALRALAPAVVGADPAGFLAVGDRMDAVLTGHEYAKSAIDVACWDAAARARGVSVTTLLGGLRNESYPLYVAIPLGDPSAMAEHVAALRADGITRFQLKVGDSPRVDADRERALHDPGGRRRGRHAGRPRPRLRRAAVPDARGVPLRARALVSPVRPRRVHLRRPVARARARGGSDGGVQPQDLKGGRAHQSPPDARPGRRARPHGHDRGHLGRRSRHGRRLAPCGEHDGTYAVHGVVHERLDERARRGVPAPLVGWARVGAHRPRAGGRGGSGQVGGATLEHCGMT